MASMQTDIVAFDLNKTLIKENSWYDLNLAMGITAQEDEFLYRLGPEGEGILTFEEWIDILARLMKARGKASRKAIEAVILKFNYLEGAKEAVAAIKAKGHRVGIITGALSPVAEKAAKELDVDFIYCNARMEFDADDMLTDIRLHGPDFKFKVDIVEQLRAKYPEAEIYYVADGDNDAEIFKITRGIMIDAHGAHEDWKRQAIEDGDEFSSHLAKKHAWKVVPGIKDVSALF